MSHEEPTQPARVDSKPSEVDRLRALISDYADAAIEHDAKRILELGLRLNAAVTVLCVELEQLRAAKAAAMVDQR